MAAHCSVLAWRSLVDCSPWGHKESDTTECSGTCSTLGSPFAVCDAREAPWLLWPLRGLFALGLALLLRATSSLRFLKSLGPPLLSASVDCQRLHRFGTGLAPVEAPRLPATRVSFLMAMREDTQPAPRTESGTSGPL